jgi:hypothetical protein
MMAGDGRINLAILQRTAVGKEIAEKLRGISTPLDLDGKLLKIQLNVAHDEAPRHTPDKFAPNWQL